ncbi:MAG: hypothetical protein K2K93_09815 [Muribaculaceae bacterium]|nr:hypothetical protein [Muribaculaceae bacterium]
MKYVLTFLTLAFCLVSSAQVSVGVRNNRYFYGAYCLKDHYVAALEQSVFSEDFGYQYMRGYAGYKGNIKSVEYGAYAYFGSTFNRSYYSSGLIARAQWLIKKRFILKGSLNPHYDSAEGYSTCWEGTAGVKTTSFLDIFAEYGDIPEYRLPEYRLKVGFKFHVGSLSVVPKLSLLLESGFREKSLRPIVDFNYTF